MEKQLEETQLNICPVAWQVARNPHLVAIQTDHQKINFTELHLRICSLSLQLLNLNMKKGDRLVCIAANGLPLALLQLTCIRNGFIFCPLNPNFSQAEADQRLTLLNSPFIWQESEKNRLLLDFENFCQSSSQNTATQANKIAALNVISIIFTSGSSGLPKAVMHNFSNHYYSALGSQTVIPLTSGDKNLLSLPIFHISGYATVMRSILAGATLHIMHHEKVNASNLRNNKITHLSLVSSQLKTLLDDPKFEAHSLSIKHLLLGGSAFSQGILEQTKMRGFTYHLSYGSTEMASQVATSTDSEILEILPYRKIKIIEQEIQLTGKTRFVGYFTGNINSGLMDQQHYFASSDLGEFNGKTLKISGRKDRQFISGGENIQPEEIENILLTFKGLSQAYVLPITDPVYGQRPIAFIQWDDETQTEQLKLYLQDKLIAFKRPIDYFPLPIQQGIKLDKKQLFALSLKLFPKK